MYVGVCRLLLATPAHTLKDKRSILRRIKDRTAAKWKVHVAEVDLHDAYNRAVLGFAVVAADAPHCDRVLDGVARFIAAQGLADVVDEDRRVMQFDDIDFAAEQWMEGKFE
ncbi:MAG: DUF503 domain-containing protein [Deltaproteobacteria bacterium]|nr:MAG: DUF503 domain-containing protein [Deltaproteobacteria bacterium]